jgi:hypothetical protein
MTLIVLLLLWLSIVAFLNETSAKVNERKSFLRRPASGQRSRDSLSRVTQNDLSLNKIQTMYPGAT